MEDILHYLGCIKICKWYNIYHISWCRISSINSITDFRLKYIASFAKVTYSSTKNPGENVDFQECHSPETKIWYPNEPRKKTKNNSYFPL